MFVEHSVPTANRGPSISVGIPGKAYAGSGIEQVTRHATHGDARVTPHWTIPLGKSSRSEAIVSGKIRGDVAVRVDGGLAGNVMCRIEVEGLVFLLAIGAEQAHAHAEVQRNRLVMRQSS